MSPEQFMFLAMTFVVALLVIVAVLLFRRRLRSIRAKVGIGGIDFEASGDPEELPLRSVVTTARPEPSRRAPLGSEPELPLKIVDAPSTPASSPSFMSDDYVTSLAVKLQMSSRPGDYLSVADHNEREPDES